MPVIASSLFARRDVVFAGATGLAAIGVSAVGSATASLWGDEAASVLSAERPLPSLAVMAQHVDAVHTLYYLGLHFWIGAVGASPFAIRFPSAVAIGVAVTGVVLLGCRLRGLRFGVLAGAIAAILPRVTDVGTEARSYAFTAAIAVVLTLLVVVQLQAPMPRRSVWVAYSALLAMGTLLFLWLALIAVAHGVALLLARPGAAKAWFVSFTVALITASPVLTLAVLERGQVAYLATRQSFGVTALFVTPWFENPWVALGLWPLVLGGIALSIRDGLTGVRRRHVPTHSSRTALLLLFWLLVPSITLIAGSAVVAVYTPRYLAMCAPAVALLAALPLDALLAAHRRPLTGAAGLALLAIVALIAPVWAQQRTPYSKNNSDWAVISAELGANARAGDAVAFDDSVRPSRRTRLALRTYPAGFAGLDDVTLKTPWYDTATWYDATYTLSQARALGRLAGVQHIWLVEYALPGHVDSGGMAAAVAAGFAEVRTIRNHRSVIIEFERVAG
ncbi:MAG: hypothetical protein ABJA11_11995 [Pseudolysinimonas sp.]